MKPFAHYTTNKLYEVAVILSERDRRHFSRRLQTDLETGVFMSEFRAFVECLLSGIWIGWPFFRYYTGNSNAYNTLNKLMPATSMGFVFYGFAMAIALGYASGYCALRRLASFLLIFVWAAISGLMIMDRVSGWVAALIPAIVLFETIRSIRLGERCCGTPDKPTV